METVRGAGMAMLNEDRTHAGSDEPVAPVYFDREPFYHFLRLPILTRILVFGLVFVVLTQRSLFLLNIFLLVAGPIAIASLCVTFSKYPERIYPVAIPPDKWTIVREQGKFWVSFVVGLALQLILGLSFMKINPFVRRVHLLSTGNSDAFPLRLFIRIPTSFLVQLITLRI